MTPLIAAAVGAAGWTASEYLIHRFLGHEWAKRRNFFSVEHVRHHATTSYFAPTSLKAQAAVLTAAAVAPLARRALGASAGLAFTGGFVAMYVTYEVLHRRAHTHPPTGRYGRWLRRHHFHHHFAEPKMNHGVTSPVFDYVFRTHRTPPGKIRVPARHAMTWLVDDAGEVRPEHAADYEVVAKGKPPAAETSVSAAPRPA